MTIFSISQFLKKQIFELSLDFWPSQFKYFVYKYLLQKRVEMIFQLPWVFDKCTHVHNLKKSFNAVNY